jgi:hypothetical protein
MSFTAKPSKAVHLWLGILGAVLVVLFFETRASHSGGNNFFINTDLSAVGASVIVDGKQAGTIGSANGSGIGGGAFWMHLSRGQHKIEVIKPGYKPYSTEIDMHGEEYLGVDLKSARD